MPESGPEMLRRLRLRRGVRPVPALTRELSQTTTPSELTISMRNASKPGTSSGGGVVRQARVGAGGVPDLNQRRPSSFLFGSFNGSTSIRSSRGGGVSRLSGHRSSERSRQLGFVATSPPHDATSSGRRSRKKFSKRFRKSSLDR